MRCYAYIKLLRTVFQMSVNLTQGELEIQSKIPNKLSSKLRNISSEI